jgi:hypothetical protein
MNFTIIKRINDKPPNIRLVVERFWLDTRPSGDPVNQKKVPTLKMRVKNTNDRITKFLLIDLSWLSIIIFRPYLLVYEGKTFKIDFIGILSNRVSSG